MALLRLRRGTGTPAALLDGEPALDLTVARPRLFAGVNGTPRLIVDHEAYVQRAGDTMSGGLSFGSVAQTDPLDLSRHIALFGNDYGFSITSGTLNYVSGVQHAFHGQVVLDRDPIQPEDAVTRRYVDARDALYLPLTGGALANPGNLNVAGEVRVNLGVYAADYSWNDYATGALWNWYADLGAARLWYGPTDTDLMTIDTSGDLHATSNIFVGNALLLARNYLTGFHLSLNPITLNRALAFQDDSAKLEWANATGSLYFASFGGLQNFVSQGSNGHFWIRGAYLAAPIDPAPPRVTGDYTLGLDAIRRIQPRTYEAVDGTEQIGLVAADLQDALPEAIAHIPTAQPVEEEAEESGLLGIGLMTLIVTLINAVKELDTRVAELTPV